MNKPIEGKDLEERMKYFTLYNVPVNKEKIDKLYDGVKLFCQNAICLNKSEKTSTVASLNPILTNETQTTIVIYPSKLSEITEVVHNKKMSIEKATSESVALSIDNNQYIVFYKPREK